MTRYRRWRQAGGTFFFTVVTFGRRRFLTDDDASRCLRSPWRETVRHRPFETVAVCLLPDHLHCLWTLQPDDEDYSTRWAKLKEAFTKQYLAQGGQDGTRNASRRRKREAAIWQRRFWEHTIRDDVDFQRHFDYIHYNPVKHGLVTRVADWPWSTFHRYVKKQWYDPDWGSVEPPGTDELFDRYQWDGPLAHAETILCPRVPATCPRGPPAHPTGRVE